MLAENSGFYFIFFVYWHLVAVLNLSQESAAPFSSHFSCVYFFQVVMKNVQKWYLLVKDFNVDMESQQKMKIYKAEVFYHHSSFLQHDFCSDVEVLILSFHEALYNEQVFSLKSAKLVVNMCITPSRNFILILLSIFCYTNQHHSLKDVTPGFYCYDLMYFNDLTHICDNISVIYWL